MEKKEFEELLASYTQSLMELFTPDEIRIMLTSISTFITFIANKGYTITHQETPETK